MKRKKKARPRRRRRELLRPVTPDQLCSIWADILELREHYRALKKGGRNSDEAYFGEQMLRELDQVLVDYARQQKGVRTLRALASARSDLRLAEHYAVVLKLVTAVERVDRNVRALSQRDLDGAAAVLGVTPKRLRGALWSELADDQGEDACAEDVALMVLSNLYREALGCSVPSLRRKLKARQQAFRKPPRN